MPIRRCAELAALVFIAAPLMPTAIALGEAGDDCGAAPQAGTITVAAGTISCADATERFSDRAKDKDKAASSIHLILCLHRERGTPIQRGTSKVPIRKRWRSVARLPTQ